MSHCTSNVANNFNCWLLETYFPDQECQHTNASNDKRNKGVGFPPRSLEDMKASRHGEKNNENDRSRQRWSVPNNISYVTPLD